VASGRHKLLSDLPRSPRFTRIGVPALAAVLVTGTVVGGAVAWPENPATSAASAISRPTATASTTPAASDRVEVSSRSAPRVKLKAKPEPKKEPKPTPPPEPTEVAASEIVGHQFMTTALNVWSGPGESFTLLEVLPAGTKVPVTGEVEGEWAEISYDGLSRWVNAAYLADEKPRPPEPEETEEPEARVASGLSGAACASGSDVESGLGSNAIAVHRSVCANFPQVTSYGGLRSDGEHSQGLALDIMTPDSGTGDAIAEFVRSNAGSLGVSEVIWAQQIWTVQRSSEGWRGMEDRGSTTANHYDHVHVTVY
jgi:hypothetical protein